MSNYWTLIHFLILQPHNMPLVAFLLGCIALLSSCAPNPPSSVRSLVETMRATENPVPYLTFKQISSFYKADTVVEEQTWWEAMAFPHQLHIRFGKFKAGNAVVFNHGQRYFFKAGQQIRTEYKPHELLLFSSGLRLNPVDSSLNYLVDFGIDTSILAVAEIDGRKCYGIGAQTPEADKNQLWIDAERLYFKQSKLNVEGHWQKVRFSDFKALAAEQYVETSVTIWVDGDLFMTEKYEDIATPESLSPAVFDPERFAESSWR